MSHLRSCFLKQIKIDLKTGCWLWQGFLRKGYGRFHAYPKAVSAHVLAYKVLIGPIPKGLQLDHICNTKNCVNPWHLEPVTQLVNIRRRTPYNRTKTHCPKGHPYEGDNLFIRRSGRRRCIQCQREHDIRYYWQNRIAILARKKQKRWKHL
jgi:hypothetical protein